MSNLNSISISDAFCGGNIDFTENPPDADGKGKHQVLLRIEPDVFSKLEKTYHYQYFCFRCMLNDFELVGSKEIEFIIENAGDVSYPVAWKGTTVFYTDNMADPDSWLRKLDTTYADGKLMWTHTYTPQQTGSMYFSYFPPYTYHQHLEFIDRCQNSATANVRSLGQTLQGRELECVSVGNGDRVCWIIHRQHPGEPMAEYYAEGLLTRLLGLDTDGKVDDAVRNVLSLYEFYIIPCMCPDGAVLGHLRTNSVGANLNREWHDSGAYKAPSAERSPEVLAVLNKMDETGVDCFLDIHGDEELPFNFLSGPVKTKNWGKRLESLYGAFLGAYVRANSDMQKEVAYAPPAKESEVSNNVASNAIANRFNCLSATLEMPFKDCLTNPDPERGWNPKRSRMLGASVIEALAYVHPYLRDESEFWKSLPEDDAYVTPSPVYSD